MSVTEIMWNYKIKMRNINGKNIPYSVGNISCLSDSHSFGPELLVLSVFLLRNGGLQHQKSLIKDSTWKHIFIFLLASVIVYEGDKWLTAQNQIKQEKICIYTLLATSVTAFLLGSIYVLNNPYYPVGDQISATAFAAYCRDGNFIMLCSGGYVGMYQQQKDWGYYTRCCLPCLEISIILRQKSCM